MSRGEPEVLDLGQPRGRLVDQAPQDGLRDRALPVPVNAVKGHDRSRTEALDHRADLGLPPVERGGRLGEVPPSRGVAGQLVGRDPAPGGPFDLAMRDVIAVPADEVVLDLLEAFVFDRVARLPATAEELFARDQLPEGLLERI
ncbi:hypothetical protein [Baekduia sp. Peel2402]|uniref:hypothetical protein n=1 Tax=Baekduia sp. Peel2402 TaxID=3458296 RepID=UPI00403E5232